jgi:hypothetical protein
MANRYWVGDSGKWSDTAHWSASSGSTPGEAVPSTADDVFFDANSFSTGSQTITIDALAYCNNLNTTGISNSPSIVLSSSITLYGSITLTDGINTITGGGDFLFTKGATSSAEKTIDLGGIDCTGIGLYLGYNNARVRDNYTLLSSVTIDNLSVTGASFDANDADITCTSAVFTGLAGGGASEINVSLGAGTLSIVDSTTNTENRVKLQIGDKSLGYSFVNFDAETSTISIDCENSSGIILSLDAPSNLDNLALYNLELAGATEFIFDIEEDEDLTLNALTSSSSIVVPPSSNIITSETTINGEEGSNIDIKNYPASEFALSNAEFSTTETQGKLSATTPTFSYVTVENMYADGSGIPFDATVGGINHGNNTNWLFGNQDDWSTDLQNAPHPSAAKEDIMMFGNGRYVGAYFKDTDTLTVDQLDFGNNSEVADILFHANQWWIAVNHGVSGTNRTKGQIYLYDGGATSAILADETAVGFQKIGFLYVLNGVVYVAYQDLSSGSFAIGYISDRQLKPLGFFTGSLPNYQQKTLYKNTILFVSGEKIWSAGAVTPSLPFQVSQLADGGYATVGALAAPFGTPMVSSTNATNYRLAKFSGYSILSKWKSVIIPLVSSIGVGFIDQIRVLTKTLGAGAKCNLNVESNQGTTVGTTKAIEGTGKRLHTFTGFGVGKAEDIRLSLDWTGGSASNDCAIRKIIVQGHTDEF